MFVVWHHLFRSMHLLYIQASNNIKLNSLKLNNVQEQHKIRAKPSGEEEDESFSLLVGKNKKLPKFKLFPGNQCRECLLTSSGRLFELKSKLSPKSPGESILETSTEDRGRIAIFKVKKLPKQSTSSCSGLSDLLNLDYNKKHKAQGHKATNRDDGISNLKNSFSRSMQELSICSNFDKNEKTVNNAKTKKNVRPISLDEKKHKDSRNEMVKKGLEERKSREKKEMPENENITTSSSDSRLIQTAGELFRKHVQNKMSNHTESTNLAVYSVCAITQEKASGNYEASNGESSYSKKSSNPRCEPKRTDSESEHEHVCGCKKKRKERKKKLKRDKRKEKERKKREKRERKREKLEIQRKKKECSCKREKEKERRKEEKRRRNEEIRRKKKKGASDSDSMIDCPKIKKKEYERARKLQRSDSCSKTAIEPKRSKECVRVSCEPKRSNECAKVTYESKRETLERNNNYSRGSYERQRSDERLKTYQRDCDRRQEREPARERESYRCVQEPRHRHYEEECEPRKPVNVPRKKCIDYHFRPPTIATIRPLRRRNHHCYSRPEPTHYHYKDCQQHKPVNCAPLHYASEKSIHPVQGCNYQARYEPEYHLEHTDRCDDINEEDEETTESAEEIEIQKYEGSEHMFGVNNNPCPTNRKLSDTNNKPCSANSRTGSSNARSDKFRMIPTIAADKMKTKEESCPLGNFFKNLRNFYPKCDNLQKLSLLKYCEKDKKTDSKKQIVEEQRPCSKKENCREFPCPENQSCNKHHVHHSHNTHSIHSPHSAPHTHHPHHDHPRHIDNCKCVKIFLESQQTDDSLEHVGEIVLNATSTSTPTSDDDGEYMNYYSDRIRPDQEFIFPYRKPEIFYVGHAKQKKHKPREKCHKKSKMEKCEELRRNMEHATRCYCTHCGDIHHKKFSVEESKESSAAPSSEDKHESVAFSAPSQPPGPNSKFSFLKGFCPKKYNSSKSSLMRKFHDLRYLTVCKYTAPKFPRFKKGIVEEKKPGSPATSQRHTTTDETGTDVSNTTDSIQLKSGGTKRCYCKPTLDDLNERLAALEKKKKKKKKKHSCCCRCPTNLPLEDEKKKKKKKKRRCTCGIDKESELKIDDCCSDESRKKKKKKKKKYCDCHDPKHPSPPSSKEVFEHALEDYCQDKKKKKKKKLEYSSFEQVETHYSTCSTPCLIPTPRSTGKNYNSIYENMESNKTDYEQILADHYYTSCPTLFLRSTEKCDNSILEDTDSNKTDHEQILSDDYSCPTPCPTLSPRSTDKCDNSIFEDMDSNKTDCEQILSDHYNSCPTLCPTLLPRSTEESDLSTHEGMDSNKEGYKQMVVAYYSSGAIPYLTLSSRSAQKCDFSSNEDMDSNKNGYEQLVAAYYYSRPITNSILSSGSTGKSDNSIHEDMDSIIKGYEQVVAAYYYTRPILNTILFPISTGKSDISSNEALDSNKKSYEQVVTTHYSTCSTRCSTLIPKFTEKSDFSGHEDMDSNKKGYEKLLAAYYSTFPILYPTLLTRSTEKSCNLINNDVDLNKKGFEQVVAAYYCSSCRTPRPTVTPKSTDDSGSEKTIPGITESIKLMKTTWNETICKIMDRMPSKITNKIPSKVASKISCRSSSVPAGKASSETCNCRRARRARRRRRRKKCTKKMREACKKPSSGIPSSRSCSMTSFKTYVKQLQEWKMQEERKKMIAKKKREEEREEGEEEEEEEEEKSNGTLLEDPSKSHSVPQIKELYVLANIAIKEPRKVRRARKKAMKKQRKLDRMKPRKPRKPKKPKKLWKKKKKKKKPKKTKQEKREAREKKRTEKRNRKEKKKAIKRENKEKLRKEKMEEKERRRREKRLEKRARKEQKRIDKRERKKLKKVEKRERKEKKKVDKKRRKQMKKKYKREEKREWKRIKRRAKMEYKKKRLKLTKAEKRKLKKEEKKNKRARKIEYKFNKKERKRERKYARKEEKKAEKFEFKLLKRRRKFERKQKKREIKALRKEKRKAEKRQRKQRKKDLKKEMKRQLKLTKKEQKRKEKRERKLLRKELRRQRKRERKEMIRQMKYERKIQWKLAIQAFKAFKRSIIPKIKPRAKRNIF